MIRSPLWDGFWIWGGLPIGAALTFVGGNPMAIAFMIFETGHVVSPMIIAWSKPGLRSIIAREWVRHIALPIVIMALVVPTPIIWVTAVYAVWNSYHFGMQIFGVGALYRYRVIGFVTGCVTALSVAFSNPHNMTPLLGAVSFQHWMTDIGLSSRVARLHLGFIISVVIIGIAWLVLRNGPLSVQLTPKILNVRAGIGIIHFIYSARIWKLSDPKIRATIGEDLFA